MNNEIKEIELWKEKTKGIFHITEYTRFWNYMTNLVQENDDVKNRLENAVADCNLRLQENERLRNHIQMIPYLQTVREKDDYKSRVEKAVEYYKMHQQECVIGRNRDDKLIKDYYLPAQHSKVLLNILQNGSDVK